MMTFKSSARWLDGLDPEVAAGLIAAAADVTLILDRHGIILDYAFQTEQFAREFSRHDQWVGMHWGDLVTVESRPKLQEMIEQASVKASVSWRQVNYPTEHGPDIPILFSTVHIERTRCVIAFGRDLRAISSLQQRLVDAQASLERDYSRLRHAETRYRILFQMSSEPVLILDAQSHKVIEANPAARRLFGDEERIIGRQFLSLVDESSIPDAGTMLASVRATGRADNVTVKLAEGVGDVCISAFLFRQGEAQLYLTRLAGMDAAGHGLIPENKVKLLKMIETVPDGFVVTGPDGRVIAANAAFIEMIQLLSEDQVRGQSIERWLGRPGVDLPVLLTNLRQHGSVRLYPTSLRDEYGTMTEVEISAVAVMTGAQPSFGFAIRSVSRRLSQDMAGQPANDTRGVPRSLEQITELIGRVSLKELVREATNVIEHLSIEAALAMTSDNRASAAEVLGLSRQSLYVKMRRYGLMDADATE